MRHRMALTHPLNFADHDERMKNQFEPDLAGGRVITRYGEGPGRWRVVVYDPEVEHKSGRYEFVLDRQNVVPVAEVCISGLSDEERPCALNVYSCDQRMARSPA